MKRAGVLFPGQGSQYVGMARDVLQRYPEIHYMCERASDILGYDIREVMFGGPIEALTQTRVCQPAIFLHSMVLAELLKKAGIAFGMVAGHSLGEFSAATAAGAFNFEDGMGVVKIRGELVQKAGELVGGSMAAIIGLSDEQVGTLCHEAAGDGVLVPANFNAPSQVVISGDKDAVNRGMEHARAMGAKKVIALKVSGAFHSPFMKVAQDGLDKAVAEVPMRDADVPIISNVTAQPMRSVQEVRGNLVRQMTSPVRWGESMETMISGGMDFFIEVGPGSVLKGLLKRIDRDAECISIDTAADVEQLLSGI